MNKVYSFFILLLVIALFPLVSLVASKWGANKGVEIRQELNRFDFPPIPAFTLTDQTGAKFDRSAMKGKVTVASFFFSSCVGPCPKTMAELSRVQKEFRLEPNLLVLSFSVDPEHDSAQVLNEYGKRFNVDHSKWKLLTGPSDQIFSLLNDGFKVAAAEGDGTAESITHTTKFVLIDTSGKIRNYYDGLVPEEVNKMIEHIAMLTPKNH